MNADSDPRQFPADETDLEGSETAEVYILELLKVAADDARNIVVLATVAVGAVVILIKDVWRVLMELSLGLKLGALASAVLLLVAAALMYWYAARINQRRMSIVRCLASSDARRARQLWAHPDFGIQKDAARILSAGISAGVIGALLFVFVLGAALVT